MIAHPEDNVAERGMVACVRAVRRAAAMDTLIALGADQMDAEDGLASAVKADLATCELCVTGPALIFRQGGSVETI